MVQLLVTQVIALSWFRCLMEEGFDFINQFTGEIETNEVTIYKNFNQNTGAFLLPTAKCSPKGLEKNLYEVIGNLLIHNTNPEAREALNSPEFVTLIKRHLEKVKAREYSGRVPT